MNEIYIRKTINENGEEVIELDLNKPWPRRMESSYPSYKDDVERLMLRERKHSRKGKEFITILN